VLVYDRSPGHQRVADAMAPSPALAADLAVADLVVLALPERVIWSALPVITSCLAPGALIVETGSVKAPMVPLCKAAPPGIEILGINPMFAPAIGFSGQNVALVRYKHGPMCVTFEACLREWNARVTALDGERHDHVMAVVQAALHAAILSFGAVLVGAPVELDEMLAVATPPFRAMLFLIARILGQSAEVYWDIQALNVWAAAARAKLAAGVSTCDELALQPQGLPAFEAWLARMSGTLKPILPELQHGAQSFLGAVPAIKP
jgi:prephenate dehydrogenase